MAQPTDQPPTTRRRALLAATGTTLLGTAGCLRRVTNLTSGPQREQLQLTIKMLPADSDPFSLAIATHLADGLEAVGIDDRLVPTPAETLAQELLLSRNFDICVARLPTSRSPDPDSLYPLLHSRFSDELGWQNPFGFTNLSIDDLLADQRAESGETRRETVDELQAEIAETQPFTPVYLPEVITAVRTDRFSGWEAAVGDLPYGLLRLKARGDDDSLRLVSTDGRPVVNHNPLSAIHHDDRSTVGLLYEPLVVDDGDDRLPWLATEISWDDDPLRATVVLRKGLQWHDDESLTADDVVFTYRLLADTSLGELENPVPTTRFRGESTLVSDVEVTGKRQLTVEFDDASRSVAERALSVPILPEHVWRERTGSVSIGDVEIDSATTEAIVTDNRPPVGSGPLEFEAADSESLTLTRFDDHFLTSTDDERLAAYHGGPAFAELSVEVVSSSGSALELLANDGADCTLSPMETDSVGLIDDSSELASHTYDSHAIYHLAFNTQGSPLSNPKLRRLVARLVDKAALVAEFDDFGQPAAGPLAGTDWLASDLEWTDDGDPAVPFLGSDGEVDEEAAREAFREAGFQYDKDGNLLVPES
ncbi:MAG: ABC transporter substrate-binding protein [Halohasta sp.]